jgi:hypothetical protein
MDKSYIKNSLQDILNTQFKLVEKRRIYDYHDRMNFACPYCGDSSTDRNAKRGNIWWNKLIFVCFNCDHRTSFDKMCRDFNQQLDPGVKLEIIEHIASNVTYSDFEDNAVETQMSKLLSLEELTKLFNTYETPITDFKPVEKGSPTYHYLVTKRGIPEDVISNIYEGNYWRNAESKEGIICLLNRRGGKVLGMQIRNMKDGRARFFKIYNYESLYKWLYGEEKLADFDLNELVLYNKLSYYFGILNIDVMEKVTVFEGYLDSLFYPNSIGVVGVNTDMRFIEANLDMQYFFDNDGTGHKNSAMKLKEGFSVFLWKKLFDNLIEKKKPSDPFTYLQRISAIKDLNKLAQLTGGDPYKKLDLPKFFSRDQYDAVWIPKQKKEYNPDAKRKYNSKFNKQVKDNRNI